MTRRPTLTELTLATVLVAILTIAWSVAGWTPLRALLLPDPDDMLRLVQLRDWIGGQAFDDLSQHRLGGGLALHWSRLPDLVPAALILLIEPFAGRHAAELATVILWPAILFVAALTLLASCARAYSDRAGAGVVAILAGALAYPATAFFLPGRIDHHGLQLVLLLIAARAMLAAASTRTGAVVGVAVAASIAIGLETAPLCAVVLAVLAWRWVIEGGERSAMLIGVGAGLGGGMLLAIVGFAPRIWPAALCDAFTPPVAWMTLLASGLIVALGVVGRRIEVRAQRLAALAVAGVVLGGALPLLAPACLEGPYGALPPLTRTLWLRHVAEAQPLLAAAPGVMLGYGGLMLAGLIVAGVRITRGGGSAQRTSWFALQLAVAVLACVQLRVAPFGAALAVPVLADMVLRARASGRPLKLVAAWLVAAGLVYPLAGSAIGRGEAGAAARPPCLTRNHLARIAAAGAGGIAVPLDLGPYVLAASDRSVLAAPYHRNAAANLAHYRIFLSSPRVAHAAARRWGVATIAYCPAWLPDLDPGRIARPGSIVAKHGKAGAIDWASPVAVDNGLVILRVKP